MDTLPPEMLNKVFRYLPIRDRVHVERVAREWQQVQTEWTDVERVHMSTSQLTMAGRGYSNSITPGQCGADAAATDWQPSVLDKLVKKCSAAKLVIIDDAHLLARLGDSIQHLESIETLVLPSNAFQSSRNGPVKPQLTHLLSAPNLRELHVIQRWDVVAARGHVFTTTHFYSLRTKSLREIQLQGIAMEPKAMQLLATKFATTLRELRIGGVVCHSPRANDYIRAICDFKSLRALEIPPSVFSIANIAPLHSNIEMLRKMKGLDELSLYVCWPDVTQMKHVLKRVVPRCLQRLWLCDWTNRFPHDWPKELTDTKASYDIVFLPRHFVELRLPWMHGSSSFMLQSFWSPPYFPVQDNRGQSLTNEQITAQHRNWEYIDPDLAIETAVTLLDASTAKSTHDLDLETDVSTTVSTSADSSTTSSTTSTDDGSTSSSTSTSNEMSNVSIASGYSSSGNDLRSSSNDVSTARGGTLATGGESSVESTDTSTSSSEQVTTTASNNSTVSDVSAYSVATAKSNDAVTALLKEADVLTAISAVSTAIGGNPASRSSTSTSSSELSTSTNDGSDASTVSTALNHSDNVSTAISQ